MKYKELRERIQSFVDYASENMGNDVLLSQTTDDILEILYNSIIDECLGEVFFYREGDKDWKKGKWGNRVKWYGKGFNQAMSDILKRLNKLKVKI